MVALKDKRCVPVHDEMLLLNEAQQEELLEELDNGWEVIAEHHLFKEFGFEDFISALEFVNQVGRLAEEEGHHPDLTLSWGKATVKIYTHQLGGLTESDFVLAAKIEQL